MAANINKPRGKKPDKLMRDAISIELQEELQVPDPKNPGRFIRAKKYRLLARSLINEGLKGDVPAIREVNDRMDGKVPSPISGTGRDGAIPIDLRGLSDEQLEDLLERIIALESGAKSRKKG